MVRYTLSLHTEDSPPGGYQHSLALDQYYEDNPEQIFTQSMRQRVQNELQQISLCTIRENHLNQIINTWIEDIQEGYRETQITLDLPSLFEANVYELRDNGNQKMSPFFLPDLTGIEPTVGMLPPLEEIHNL